jgi:hypothetical protein
VKENYRRSLTSWLRQIETELAEMRAVVQFPRDTALLAQRIEGSQERALAALNAVLNEIDALASELNLPKSEENVLWSAHTQLISAEISVGELLPRRWPGGPALVGDGQDVALVDALLNRLLRRIIAARESLQDEGGKSSADA